jgi:hypothetical protein
VAVAKRSYQRAICSLDYIYGRYDSHHKWCKVRRRGSLILSRNRTKVGEEDGCGAESGDGVDRESDRLHFVSKQSLISGRQVENNNLHAFPHPLVAETY